LKTFEVNRDFEAPSMEASSSTGYQLIFVFIFGGEFIKNSPNQKLPYKIQTAIKRIRRRLYARIKAHLTCGLGRPCNPVKRLDIRGLELKSKTILGIQGYFPMTSFGRSALGKEGARAVIQ
jgi:hypothetical protein